MSHNDLKGGNARNYEATLLYIAHAKKSAVRTNTFRKLCIVLATLRATQVHEHGVCIYVSLVGAMARAGVTQSSVRDAESSVRFTAPIDSASRTHLTFKGVAKRRTVAGRSRDL